MKQSQREINQIQENHKKQLRDLEIKHQRSQEEYQRQIDELNRKNNSVFATLWHYCRPCTIKQIITQHPWLTAGFVTITLVFSYSFYKTWI